MIKKAISKTLTPIINKKKTITNLDDTKRKHKYPSYKDMD